MKNFKVLAGDVLINVNTGTDLWSKAKRWAVGPYSHVFLYMGKVGIEASEYPGAFFIRVPLLFESNGRGVILQSLSNRYEQEVTVMRLISEYDRRRISAILQEAIKLASDPQAYYDYFCVIRFIFLRIICEKLKLPIPLTWHRDERQICSEAVFEIFYRAKLVDILPNGIVPLPGDFVTSRLLEEVWRGKLSDEVV